MQHAPQTARVEPPPATHTKTDAQTTVAGLSEVMEGLQSVVEEETTLVRAGRLCEASRLAPKKTELSGRYFKAVEELKANSKRLARNAPDQGVLADRHERLQAVLKSNLMVLATAHAVSEGILRRLSGDLARKAMAPPGAPPDPTPTAPLALSQTL